MELHHYLRADIATNFIFDSYNKQNGGKMIRNGNNKQIYDFYMIDNQIFVGDYKHSCMTICIEENAAHILWLGHVKNCLHWKNAKHMFIWGMLVLFKNYPEVNYISLGDDTKIKCDKRIYYLAKYYFLRYGKMYYDLYFDFNVLFELNDEKKRYIKACNKRSKAKIKKKWVARFLNKNDASLFLDIFGEKDKILIEDYLSNFTLEIRKKYCDIFYRLVNEFYDEYISIYLPTSFYKKIDNREKFIKDLRKRLKQFC